jgi:hypothetical protein
MARMHDLPGQFLLTVTYFLVFYTVYFVLFGLCRGRRLGTRNPEYYYYGDYTNAADVPAADNGAAVKHGHYNQQPQMNSKKGSYFPLLTRA